MNWKTFRTAILSLPLLLLACSDSKEAQTDFEFSALPTAQKIKKALESEYLSSLGISADKHDFLNQLYAANSYSPLWINDSMLTVQGTRLEYLLEHKLALGIPDTRHYTPFVPDDNFIQRELKLTVSLALLMDDLTDGFLHPDSCAFKPIRTAPVDHVLAFKQAADTTELDHALIALGPSDTIYPILAQFLFREYHRLPVDRTTYSIQSIKKDTAETMILARKALISKGYLSNNQYDSLRISEAIRSFQHDNELAEDGVIGKVTAFALNESTYMRLNRIALAMERRRWKKDHPNKYVLINLPEYTLRFYINDSLKARHNIVIGKWGNETPQLQSSIRRIVVYPYWKVPYSIASKELLPAAQSNPNYFAKHNYKIYKKELEVDPLTVNWKAIKENAFPYTVIQDPGPTNSLGVLKFDMPNSQSIYIHDTPSKGLFQTKTRAYSHGCMRCSKPIELAKKILERDENYRGLNPMIPDSLDTLLNRKAHFVIDLLQPVPVIMVYETVVVHEDHSVHVYPDIYGREEEFVKLFMD